VNFKCGGRIWESDWTSVQSNTNTGKDVTLLKALAKPGLEDRYDNG